MDSEDFLFTKKKSCSSYAPPPPRKAAQEAKRKLEEQHDNGADMPEPMLKKAVQRRLPFSPAKKESLETRLSKIIRAWRASGVIKAVHIPFA